jgi:plasmid stabilization system protein ParE
MVAKLVVHPAFYRRLRHYRDRIRVHDGRSRVARQFVSAAEKIILQLVENPGRGHSARFESPELGDILRVSVPGFSVFAVFYRWNGETLTLITLEHTAQDLPPRLAGILSGGKN